MESDENNPYNLPLCFTYHPAVRGWAEPIISSTKDIRVKGIRVVSSFVGCRLRVAEDSVQGRQSEPFNDVNDALHSPQKRSDVERLLAPSPRRNAW